MLGRVVSEHHARLEDRFSKNLPDHFSRSLFQAFRLLRRINTISYNHKQLNSPERQPINNQQPQQQRQRFAPAPFTHARPSRHVKQRAAAAPAPRQ